MKKTKIINLAAAPGAGKTTTAHGLVYKMLQSGLNVELVSEWVKGAVWSERHKVFEDQLYITAKQNNAVNPVNSKVDFIVVDSPLFLGGIYAPQDYFPSYNKLLLEVFNSYNNQVFYLDRVRPYVQAGRIHSEEESDQIGLKILDYMKENNINYTRLDADDKAVKTIFDLVAKDDKVCKICGRELSIENDVYISDGICNFCQIS